MKLAQVLNYPQTIGETTGTYTSPTFDLTGAKTFSAQCNLTVDTPGAKTFASGVAASLVLQDLTYTAVLRGTAGNSITVAYTAGGTAGAEVVTVTGNAISVQIQDGVSTATQVRTAINASAAAIALISCTVSGTGSNAQTAAAAAPLASGANSAVDTTADTVTISSHGYTTGLKGRLTSTGTLPAGVTTGVDYFIIAVDANTIAFATSLVNAQAGTKINLTDQGSSGATNTFTPTSVAGGSIQLRKSNDGVTFSDDGSAVTFSATGTSWITKTDPEAIFYQITITVTAGRFNGTMYPVAKGLQ